MFLQRDADSAHSEQAIMTKVAILGGTGRMGVHLGCHWANLGVDVTLCSRTPQKAQVTAARLRPHHTLTAVAVVRLRPHHTITSVAIATLDTPAHPASA